jgi:death-on-curing protein
MIEYLQLSHILAMHEVLIQKYGGIYGLRDKGLLESAISQPMQSVFETELFPDIPSKAAAYAFYLSENQPFLDGNKRIATAAALTFIRLNGYDLKASEKEFYETIMKLANKKLSREKLTEWFRKNCVKKKK